GQAELLGVAGAMPLGLQDRSQERQPDRQRHEQEVVYRRHGELEPGEIELTHASASLSLAGRWPGALGVRGASSLIRCSLQSVQVPAEGIPSQGGPASGHSESLAAD